MATRREGNRREGGVGSRDNDARQPAVKATARRSQGAMSSLAVKLLGSWNRIAHGHVALSAGCSCGVGVSNLRVQDFEQDILDFLKTRHALAQGPSSIAELLANLARADDLAALPLLTDLGRSLESFEAQHSGR